MTTIHPERLLEIWKHVSQPDSDPEALPECVAIGIDDEGEYLRLSDDTLFRRSARGRWYPPGFSKYRDPERTAIASVLNDFPSDNW
jgi:hypothetical protein